MNPARSLRLTVSSLLVVLLTLSATVGPAHGAVQGTHRAAAPSAQYLTTFQVFHTSYVRNFNPFSPNALDFTAGAIYEPLYIFTTAGGGRSYPWLATKYVWSKDARTLTLTIRSGVRWSDGKPFTAKDVLFTLTYGKTFPGGDQIGYMSRNTSNIASITLLKPNRIAIRFKHVDVTVLSSLLSNIKIVPQHIWSKIKNPTAFTNPNPVGTGPFTRIERFTSQEYTLGRNPHYWQPGKPAAAGMRVPLFTGNDSANLALAHGTFDWESTFVPNLYNNYVKADPVHRHFSIRDLQGANGLFFNDKVYPFSLLGFRQAISYAVDRSKIWKIGEYGYEPPTDAIGVSLVWPTWADKSLEPAAKELASYNPSKARALLTKLHFTWKGNHLYDPKGHSVSMEISVPSGWTDYILDCRIMQREFQTLGIDTSIKLMDLAGWTDRQNRGNFSAVIQAPPIGITPYYYFNSYMSKESYVPTGQDASLKGFNLERWWSPQAEQLLVQYRRTKSDAVHHRVINGLQRIQLENLPWIPLMYSPYIYTYSTLHFTGWPSPKNDYALGPTWMYPDNVKLMTSISGVK